MALRVIQGGAELEAYEGRPFDLADQPMRPGLAHELLALDIDDDAADAVARAAASDGVPAGLWAAIAVESERSLRAAAEATGVARNALAAVLDEAARSGSSMPNTGTGRRLSAYARALRRGGATGRAWPMRLAVPYHSLVAWQHSAAAEGLPVAAWAAQTLVALPNGRIAWEAAAAERGQTLAEWIAVQAARRSSS